MLAFLIAIAVAATVYLLYSASTGGGSSSAGKLAEGIAFAEGFYVQGSRPQRNHNPGDMTLDLIGKSTGRDGPFVVYATDDDGWANLQAQINAWLGGTSAYANSSSTISDISQFYTTTDQSSWAQNVASYIGVSTDTSIGSLA
jgi:hypothetical protein